MVVRCKSFIKQSFDSFKVNHNVKEHTSKESPVPLESFLDLVKKDWIERITFSNELEKTTLSLNAADVPPIIAPALRGERVYNSDMEKKSIYLNQKDNTSSMLHLSSSFLIQEIIFFFLVDTQVSSKVRIFSINEQLGTNYWRVVICGAGQIRKFSIKSLYILWSYCTVCPCPLQINIKHVVMVSDKHFPGAQVKFALDTPSLN